MIVGVGTDLVEVARMAQTLTRTPSVRQRLFTPAEHERPVESLAATFAAKEALAKALGAPGGLSWHDAEVRRDAEGRPVFVLSGTVAARLNEVGATTAHLSLSHDGGLALAFVVLESGADSQPE